MPARAGPTIRSVFIPKEWRAMAFMSWSPGTISATIACREGIMMPIAIPCKSDATTNIHQDHSISVLKNCMVSERPIPKEIKAEAIVKLSPAKPASIEFASGSVRIQVDGVSTTDITFQLLDRYGNPIPDSEIATSASLGSTPPVATADGEKYVISFTPPGSEAGSEGQSTIAASIGDVRAETTIALDHRSSLMGLTPSVGFLTNLKNVHAPLFSLPIDWNIWFTRSGLSLGVDLGYFFYKGTFDPENYSSTLHGFVFGASVGYRIKVKQKLLISPLLAVGGLLLGNEIKQEGLEERSEGTLQLYGRLAIESGYRVGPGYIVCRVDYMLAKANKLQLFSGRIGGLGVHLGYRFAFL